jgi:cell wall-associated NlpC family hydrolase
VRASDESIQRGPGPLPLGPDLATGAVGAQATLACWRVSIGSNTTVRRGLRASLAQSHRVLASILAVVAIAAVALLLLNGGGHSAPEGASTARKAARHTTTGLPPVHATESTPTGASGGTGGLGAAPLPHGRQDGPHSAAHLTRAGTGATSSPSTGSGATGSGAIGSSHAGSSKAVTVAEVRDPEESKSFPLPASVHHVSASSPSVAAEAAVAPGAASDAEIRKELGEEEKAKSQERAAQERILTPVAGGFSVGGNGTIPIPTGVPEAVQRVVAGGNAIADFPYIWGGGHASFIANGYDCSGSVSYALAAGGLLSAPLVSGDLATWGEPGPGHWITIYANAGHTFMDVDSMWFDTAGRSGPYASRWLVSQPSLEGYSVRHPPGL